MPELHRIDGFVVTGTARATVDRIDLAHRRLGDVAVAFGEGGIDGQPVLIVATESVAGGKLTIRQRGARRPDFNTSQGRRD